MNFFEVLIYLAITCKFYNLFTRFTKFFCKFHQVRYSAVNCVEAVFK